MENNKKDKKEGIEDLHVRGKIGLIEKILKKIKKELGTLSRFITLKLLKDLDFLPLIWTFPSTKFQYRNPLSS